MTLGQQLDAMIQIAIAAGLGALVGFEREWSGKAAGLRTHMLVAIAACMLVALGSGMVQRFSTEVPGQVLRADPIRVVEAVIVGISFLGTGTIIVNRPDGQNRAIEGLTTAASILVVAAIGMAVALEATVLALLVTVLLFVVLRGVGYVERHYRPQP